MTTAKRTALFERALNKRFLARQQYQTFLADGIPHANLRQEAEGIVYWSGECDRLYSELNAYKWKDDL